MTTVAFSQWANRWDSIWKSWSSDWVASSTVAPDSGLCCHDDTSEMMTYVACQAIGGNWFADKFTADTCYFIVTSEITSDFGHVLFDSTRILLLISTGLDSVRVDSIPDVSVFSTDFSGPARIAPGETLRVQITFDPNSYEYYFPTLQIFSNSLSSPDSVLLTGYGSDEDFGYIVVSASSIDASDYQVAADFSALGANTFTAYLHHNGVPVYYWVPNHEDSTGWIEMDTVLSAAACTVRVVGYAPISTHNGDSAMLLGEGFDVEDDLYPKVADFDDWPMITTDTLVLIPNDSAEAWYAKGFREIGNILYDTLDPDTMRRYKTAVSGWWGATYDPCSVYVVIYTSYDAKTWVREGRLNDTLRSEDPWLFYGEGDTLFCLFEDKAIQGSYGRDLTSFVWSTDFGTTWGWGGIAVDTMSSVINWADDTGSPVGVYNATDNPPYHVFWEPQGDTAWFGEEYDAAGSDYGMIALSGGADLYHLSVISHPGQTNPPVPIVWKGEGGQCSDSMNVCDGLVYQNGTYYLNAHTGWQGELGSNAQRMTIYVSSNLLDWTVDGVRSCLYSQSDDMADVQFFLRDGYWQGAFYNTNYGYATSGKGRGSVLGLTPRRDDSATFYYNNKWTVTKLQTPGALVPNGYIQVTGGVAHIVPSVDVGHQLSIGLRSIDSSFAGPMIFGGRMALTNTYQWDKTYGEQVYATMAIGAGAVTQRPSTGYSRQLLKSGYGVIWQNTMELDTVLADGSFGNIQNNSALPDSATRCSMQDVEVWITEDSVRWKHGGTFYCGKPTSYFRDNAKRVLFAIGSSWDVSGRRGGVAHVDYLYVRKYLAGAQPTATLTVNP
ncbi:hypothetical protein M0R72_10860 [Candidatus Pacearchaeota archaeon]|jgi:hypothetical protein|nr:hypothetical protein [Candidatus Pacearchaeota archaeon]